MRSLQKVSLAIALALVLPLLSAGAALAADGGHLDWGNLAIRVLNFCIVIGIIWYAAGGMIKKFFVGRKESIIKEMDDAARMKKEAAEHLADIERKVANVEKEVAALLEEGKTQAEALKASILADAEKQAAAIVAQARLAAEQEGKSELEAIRNSLAEEIVAVVEKGLKEKLDAAAQQQLIDKSLTKVVIQ